MVPAPGGLRVTLASSKTVKSRIQAVPLFIPSIPGSPYCAVAAWYRALQQLAAGPNSPTFLARHGVSLTMHELMVTLRKPLIDARIPHTSRYTLHGLRRGAAQACAAQGVAQGTWQSGAVHVYMPRMAPPQRRPKPWRYVLARLGALLGHLSAGPRGGPRGH